MFIFIGVRRVVINAKRGVKFLDYREFGYPTPDIIYDIKMLVSEDFRSFHRYGGHGPMIMRDATGIRGYHTNVENASVPEPPLNQKNIPLG